MEERQNNFRELSNLEISEALGESSAQIGVYANISDVDVNTIDPLMLAESTDTQEVQEIQEIQDAQNTEAQEIENPEEALMHEMMHIQSTRFKGASWYANMANSDIVVAGIGGIGSWLTLFLSRMTPNSIVLFDPDVVELHNLGGQCYNEKAVGIRKVTAMQDICREMSRYQAILGFPEYFSMSSPATDIMLCGFDNMGARKTFYDVWKQRVNSKKTSEEKNRCLFVDGRLLMEEFQVLAITGDDVANMKEYEEEFLFPDSRMYNPQCSMKQTSHVAAMIASVMTGIVTNFMSPCEDWDIPRKIPFLTEFNMSDLSFKTTM